MAKKEITPKDTNTANDILAESKKSTQGESGAQDLTDNALPKEGDEDDPVGSIAGENNANNEADEKTIPLSYHEADIRIKTANAYNEGYQAAKDEYGQAVNEAYERGKADGGGTMQEEKKNYLLQKYGPNPVVAEKGSIQTIFSRVAWDNLKTGKDGTKDGWREMVQVPPEVQALQQQKEL